MYVTWLLLTKEKKTGFDRLSNLLKNTQLLSGPGIWNKAGRSFSSISPELHFTHSYGDLLMMTDE